MPGEHSGDPYGYKQPKQTPKPPPPRKRPTGKVRNGAPRKIGQTPAPQKPRSRPAPKPRARSGGGGGSSFNGSGEVGFGGSTSNASGILSAPAAPDINTFLTGDSTYQAQLAAMTKALANYQSQMQDTQEEYNTGYGSRLKDLNLTESRNTEDQANDYAGRGMYISGLYGKARGDLEQDFNKRESDMDLAKQQYMSGLQRDFVNFSEENNLSREKAKQDALGRRSLQYGV